MARWVPVLAILAVMALLSGQALAWQQPGGVTSLGDVRPQPFKYEQTVISVCPFNVTAADVDMETVSRVIRRDLTLSGYFKMPADQSACNRQNLKDHRGQSIDFDAWAQMGVEHYLMGTVSEMGPSYQVQIYLYDIKGRHLVLNRRYRQPKEQLRYLAHLISDEVVQYLKGSPGVARTKLLFVSEQVPGVKEAALMDADGFAAKPLTRFGKMVGGPTWGANGTETYFLSYHGNRANIYGMKLNYDSSMNVSPGDMWTIAAYGGTNHSPSWNQATGRIVMVLSKDGGSEIYSTGRDGLNERRLTETKFTEGSPSWSPDGSKVVFTSNEAGGVHLFTMNADGSGRTRLTKGPGWHDAAVWSPDGKRIAFVWKPRNESTHDIYVCNADGTNYQRLTMNQGNNESPTWAPDSRHIAFQSDRGGAWQIYMMLDDGSAQFQLTTSGRNTMPDWGPAPRDERSVNN